MSKFDRYKRDSRRLQGYDYGRDGLYFITICIKNRAPHFGDIIDRNFSPSLLGKIVEQEWLISETLRSEIMLDEYVIMPNHMHGIVVIKNGTIDLSGKRQLVDPHFKARFGPQKKTLGTLLGQFKGAVTRQANKKDIPGFEWQKNYNDRVIRDQNELESIRRYIRNNPTNWDDDEYNE